MTKCKYSFMRGCIIGVFFIEQGEGNGFFYLDSLTSAEDYELERWIKFQFCPECGHKIVLKHIKIERKEYRIKLKEEYKKYKAKIK